MKLAAYFMIPLLLVAGEAVLVLRHAPPEPKEPKLLIDLIDERPPKEEVASATCPPCNTKELEAEVTELRAQLVSKGGDTPASDLSRQLLEEQRRLRDAEQRLAQLRPRVDAAERDLAAANAQRDDLQRRLAAALATTGKPQPAGDGEVIWYGEVRGSQVVEVTGGTSNRGFVSGHLTGAPCAIRTYAKDVVITDIPRVENGFRQFSFRVNGNGLLTIAFQCVARKQ